MAWMKISEYRSRFSPSSRPDRRTVIARIERGDLVGRLEGGIWYLDPDREPKKASTQDVADAIFAQMTTRQ